MKSDFSMFLLVLLLSPLPIMGNFQNVSALTPVADLTGDWSGFAQLANVEGICEFSGKVNANIKQDGNTLVGGYSFVTTNVKTNDPDNMGFACQNIDYQENFRGTLDGSRITLNSDGGGVFTGWYASSGIKLDLRSDELVGTAQLSPTNFTPPAFEPKNTPAPPPPKEDTDGDSIYDDEDQCPLEPEDYAGDTDGCPEYSEEEITEQFPDDQFTEEEFSDEEFAEEEEKIIADKELETELDEMTSEPIIGDWVLQEEDTSLTETRPTFIEPPSPSVFEINEETKPFFKALWDGKCDILSHQWQLLSAQSGSLPIVCTGGNVFLPSGEMIQFSAGDDWELKLIDWGVEGLFAKYVYVGLPKEVRDFIRLSRDVNKMTGEMIEGPKSIYDRIESMKALHLLVSKGEGELVGGVIKFQISCPTGECKFMKLEEESDGLKLYDVPSVFDKLTKTLGVTLNHNSVYILVEYAPAETQQIPSTNTAETQEKISTNTKEKGGGCLIATATYGSELAPQVQQLRELRDNSLLQTESGTSFMTGFNHFYYSFSPTIADWERENLVFKEAVKITLTPMISSLSILNYVDMDSEESVLGYGISLIILNLGMYFVAPVIVIHTIRKKF
jgi:hypothetical protein